MHEKFGSEHNIHIHEPHPHHIHVPDWNSIGDEDTFLIDLLVDGAVFIFNLFS